MTFYFAMTNSWSLLYDEIYGDEPMTEDTRITSLESDEYDPIVGSGNTASTFTTDYKVDLDSFENISINTAECPEGLFNIPQSSNSEDTIHISTKADSTYIFESPDGGNTVTRRPINSDPTDKEVICGDYFGDSYPYVGVGTGIDDSPLSFNTFADNDDSIAHHIDSYTGDGFGSFGIGNTASVDTLNIDLSGINSYSVDPSTLNIGTHLPGGMGDDTITFGGDAKPEPNLDYKSQKYQEDIGIKDLKDYVSSTYRGHYTNKNSDTQTLDLIHSVGDAEAFCRSNALKYLSRYDKKGTAKQDILKAMHYCLLLYYFSGNTQPPDTTNARYETF